MGRRGHRMVPYPAMFLIPRDGLRVLIPQTITDGTGSRQAGGQPAGDLLPGGRSGGGALAEGRDAGYAGAGPLNRGIGRIGGRL